MNNELKVSGTQSFMGIDIPIIEGGFGVDCKVITDKTISEIHEMRNNNIRSRITDNIKRFKENIDYIDIKRACDVSTLLELGYAKQSITQAENIYLLSERGYAKLIKIMDSDKAWEVHDKLIDEYFTMRKVINSDKQKKAMLLLTIYDGGQDAVVASKELSSIEVKEATAPLIPKAEFHDAVSVAKNCINFGKFAASFQNNNKVSFGRNKLLDWCRKRNYLCSSHNLKNKPSQQMLDSGYMKYKERTNERNGKTYITYTPLLTGKGQIWLTKKLLEYFK